MCSSDLPTLCYIPSTGDQRVIVAENAVEQLERDPAGIVVDLKQHLHRSGKVRLGATRASLSRIEIAGALFSEVRKRYGEITKIAAPRTCSVAVPSTFEDHQRECVRKSAQAAGFQQVSLVDESVAAAHAWMASGKFQESEYLLVCDIGGGSVQLTLLRRDRKSTRLNSSH